MNNPLTPVWDWYRVARDSMRVTSRVLTKNVKKIFAQKHVFYSLTPEEAQERLVVAHQELDKLAVVALVAVFERTLRDCVRQAVANPSAGQEIITTATAGDTFAVAIRDQIENDIEYWNISSRLIDEVFKTRVTGALCGIAKQIIDYRHLVAHGHVQGVAPPAYTSPPLVFRRLTSFLNDAQLIQSPDL